MNARDFAIQRHGDQQYGGHPYVTHLDEVVMNLRRFFPNREAHITTVGFLHDVVEDTDTTLDEVRSLFGEDVAFLVDLVTDQPGFNRKARHAATYPRMVAHPQAIMVKICDRIANMESSLREKPSLFAMYVKEYPYFRDTLRRPVESSIDMARAWNYLDLLAKGFN